MYRQKT